MIYCKNFCKCHTVIPPNTIKKKYREGCVQITSKLAIKIFCNVLKLLLLWYPAEGGGGLGSNSSQKSKYTTQ
jgi:hypothetical protein